MNTHATIYANTTRNVKFLASLALLSFLSACTVVPIVKPNPTAPLQYSVCEDALDIPAHYRAFQGRDGWFFFDLDFETTYPLMEQTAFMTELSRALAAQGVSLVVMPVPSRAVVKPSVLYLDDPLQAGFSAEEAELAYAGFLDTLDAADVKVVDVLSAAKAYDAAGGQTFFKRDLHWNTEGAKAVAQAAAETVKQAAAGPLQPSTLVLTRNPQDEDHRGQFVNNWLYTHCSYVLPGEPLGVYTVTRTGEGGGLFGDNAPEVVLAGSSFSLEPFYYEFLAVALQSEVLNVSVGAGGAQVGLETYLLDGAYEADKPRVLVWELPLYAPPLGEEVQRQLLGSVYGSCNTPSTKVALGTGQTVSTSLRGLSPNPADTYLQFTFDDLSVLDFDVSLSYQDGTRETLEIDRSTLTLNRGRYYLTLSPETDAALSRVSLNVPRRAQGNVAVQVCAVPQYR